MKSTKLATILTILICLSVIVGFTILGLILRGALLEIAYMLA